MVTQAEIEEKTGKVVRRCQSCNGLVRQSPKGAGFDWKHVFAEDAAKCFLEPKAKARTW